MAKGHPGSAHLCNHHFRALLVGGFMASREEVEEAAWELCKLLFDLSERQRHKHYRTVRALVNNARRLGEIPECDVKEIMQFIVEAGSCDDGITTAVIGHSHGAKLLGEALKDETLIRFIQTNLNLPEEEARKRLQTVRGNLAVITLGGINMLPKGLARVVVNIRLAQDLKSALGQQIYGERYSEEVDVSITGSDIDMRPSLEKKAMGWWNSTSGWVKKSWSRVAGSPEENDAGLRSDGQHVDAISTASRTEDALSADTSNATTQEQMLTLNRFLSVDELSRGKSHGS